MEVMSRQYCEIINNIAKLGKAKIGCILVKITYLSGILEVISGHLYINPRSLFEHCSELRS